MPDWEARAVLIKNLLSTERADLTKKEVDSFAKDLEYYSASDITNLVKEGAMGPMRELGGMDMMKISKFNIRPIKLKDLQKAKQTVLPSVTKKDIEFFINWEKKYSGDKK